ncbi:MAG: hypothetical protein AAFX85_09580, partial [Pseudomonadota bacterium]
MNRPSLIAMVATLTLLAAAAVPADASAARVPAWTPTPAVYDTDLAYLGQRAHHRSVKRGKRSAPRRFNRRGR